MSGSQIVDLEEIIFGWTRAYSLPKDLANKVDYSKLCSLDVNMIKLMITHLPAEHRLDEDPRALVSAEKSHVLFSSMFSNRTDSVQTHHLSTERRTRSTCKISLTKALSLGANISINIVPPNPIINANAGFNSNITITNSNETCVEEELVWRLDSNVEVQPHSRTRAELIIKEDEYDGSFKLDTMIQGMVSVKLRKQCGELLTVITCPDISQIFTPEKGFVRLDRSKVLFTTMGKCFCRYGISQQVNLEQLPLDDY